MVYSEANIILLIQPPEDIYIPIPPKSNSYGNPVVVIVDTSLEIFRYLSPELKGFSSSKKIANNTLDKEADLYCVRPINFRRLNLEWKQNDLQLQVYDDYNEPTEVWTFSPLHSGTYQFRFIYDYPQQFGLEEVTTNWINLHFIELTNNNTIEANSVSFETIVHQSQFTFPMKGEVIPIEFGVRITNLAKIPYRFDLQRFFPEFLSPNGKFIQIGINRNHVREAEESDIPLIMPQETREFLIKNELVCNSELHHFALEGSNNLDYGGYWAVTLQQGIYQVRFNYICYSASKNMILSSTGRIQVNNFWIGQVYTPFVSIEFQNCSNY